MESIPDRPTRPRQRQPIERQLRCQQGMRIVDNRRPALLPRRERHQQPLVMVGVHHVDTAGPYDLSQPAGQQRIEQQQFGVGRPRSPATIEWQMACPMDGERQLLIGIAKVTGHDMQTMAAAG